MKAEIAIMAVNDHPDYLPAWNFASEIWKTKFGIEPVLYFYGPAARYGYLVKSGELSEKYGAVNLVPGPPYAGGRNWRVPTLLLWAACHCPGGVRTIAGVDHWPLGPCVEEFLEGHLDDKLVIPFADAYGPRSQVDWAPGYQEMQKRVFPFYPTCRITGDKEKWGDVIVAAEDVQQFFRGVVDESPEPMFRTGDAGWGLDEAFLSLRVAMASGYDVDASSTLFWDRAEPRRLRWGDDYTEEDLGAGAFSEINGARAKKDWSWARRLIDAMPEWK